MRLLFRAIVALGLILHAVTAYAEVINAGPIHNNQDAHTKCPQTCGAAGWDGQWWSKGFTSFCSCGGPNAVQRPQTIYVPLGPGTSCSAEPTQGCPGCSVSCPAGQQAHCAGGQDTSGSPMCWAQPVCECRG